MEHGDRWGSLNDLEHNPAQASEPATVARLLLPEILQPTLDGENQVAYRQGKRHLTRLVQGKLRQHTRRPVHISPRPAI